MAGFSFADKVVLITGASSGIGRALAGEFARQGAQIILVARNADKLHDIAQSLPGQHLVVPADVRNQNDCEKAVAAALAQFGRIDVLVNNAGKGYCAAVADSTVEDFRDVFETNFFGAFYFLHAVVPHMLRQRAGTIVQISSVSGFCAVPLGSAYCASKFALEGLSQSLRLELQTTGIHVLVVRPGVTDTDFFDNAKNFHAQNPFPLRRLMSANVVAKQILRAVARRQRELILTGESKFLCWLMRLSPALVDRILLHYIQARPTAK